MKARLRLSLVLPLIGVTLSCVGHPATVTRVVDGHEVAGRYVPPDAYALYLQGAYYEHRGDFDRAERAYRAALSLDSKSVELKTRVAALSCRRGQTTVEAAFASARAAGPNYGPLWLGAAQCYFDRGDLEKALGAAMTAARLAPREEETTLLVAAVLDRVGRSEEATRWRNAQTLLSPRASESLANPAIRTASTPSDLDGAIARGQLPEARAIAITLRLTGGELAARAARRGRADLALHQAELVLGADPADGDAWVAALAAADLNGKEDELRRWLSRLPPSLHFMGTDARALMDDLLARRCGQEASDAFRAAAPEDSANAEGQ